MNVLGDGLKSEWMSRLEAHDDLPSVDFLGRAPHFASHKQ